jgi:myosin-crossreactive antigen
MGALDVVIEPIESVVNGLYTSKSFLWKLASPLHWVLQLHEKQRNRARLYWPVITRQAVERERAKRPVVLNAGEGKVPVGTVYATGEYSFQNEAGPVDPLVAQR